ncbi:HugZ family protein [Nitrosovibrio sp. Nv6]|uniref:HugZ family pyridoxamine 5'-phosphate oxidase n=1 Tax=Nitrosovibrio sp. Nv6 TaxID=1855340 RepID=UPI0008C49AED|nr:DUF2470 domain-containing protein [Nitrosovibrio sp. Nv6]SEP35090.1 hypothetical protein SAMN05216316_2517 [Nitrosovibrio sp. Nv6]
MNSACAARRLLRAHRYGALCALSKKFNGHPFGSMTSYMVDHDGSPLILISTLAEHTKNIQHDPRVSLITYSQDDSDIQSQARITVVGEAQPAMDKQQIGTRYLRYFPEAQSYLVMSDFSFYRIRPLTLRYIGGFGKIHWVSAASYLVAPYPLIEQEDGVITHMNTDHRDTMRRYCRHVHQRDTLNVEMLGIDCDGFDVRADDRILRFDFTERVLDAQQARRALVEMARSAG